MQVDQGETGLLRRLGRLWLASQVRELERTKQSDVPSLLAIDTATLYKHLRRVKQLLRTRNFVFLVPSVGEFIDLFKIYMLKVFFYSLTHYPA